MQTHTTLAFDLVLSKQNKSLYCVVFNHPVCAKKAQLLMCLKARN